MPKRKRKARRRKRAAAGCKCVDNKLFKGSILLCPTSRGRMKFKKGTFRKGVPCSKR